MRDAQHMRTIDARRLANACSVSSIPVRRRALSKRKAFLLSPLVVMAIIALIAASEGKGHAQTIVVPVCYISAPTLPQSNPINCIQPRVYVPIATR